MFFRTPLRIFLSLAVLSGVPSRLGVRSSSPGNNVLASSEKEFPGHEFPRVLHLVEFRWRGRMLDAIEEPNEEERTSLEKWREIHSESWSVKTWTADELRQLVAQNGEAVLEQEPTLEHMRNIVFMLSLEGGIVVVDPFESEPVRPFDVILEKLTSATDFFAGMAHPGIPARQVEECVTSGMRQSQAIKACGSYNPVSINVMGYAPSRTGTIHRVLRQRWVFRTSPAEEILAEFDGSQVLFNWRYFQVPMAFKLAFPDTVVASVRAPLPSERYEEDMRMAEQSSQIPGCTGTEPWAHEIPKIIHQVWVSNKGSKPIPPSIIPLIQEVKMKHEMLGWQFKLWGNELYDMYADEIPLDLYREDSRVPAAVVSDHFRLLLLRDFGGVAMDADAKAIRSFGQLHEQLSAVNVTFFVGSNFPKPGRKGKLGGNMVGLRGGPPFAFVAIGASNCSTVLRGLLQAGLPEGRWYWPSQVEARSEWAIPLHNGWGMALEATGLVDDHARVLSFRFFSDAEVGPMTILDHNRHHLWSWFDRFQAWKKEEEHREHDRSQGEL